MRDLSGYVYLIKLQENLVKIGFCSKYCNVANRVSYYRGITKNTKNLKPYLWDYVWYHDAKGMEAWLHRRFRKWNIRIAVPSESYGLGREIFELPNWAMEDLTNMFEMVKHWHHKERNYTYAERKRQEPKDKTETVNS